MNKSHIAYLEHLIDNPEIARADIVARHVAQHGTVGDDFSEFMEMLPSTDALREYLSMLLDDPDMFETDIVVQGICP
ncbi:MAG: hypothetical protein II336_05645 [Loktanella sp.]|nr:hypothetical protein [Loktanella sp.]